MSLADLIRAKEDLVMPKEKGIGPVPRPMPLGPSGCILRASWVGDALKSYF
jgi:hypothetical protein